MFFFDPMYFVFALPALLLALFAQWKVKSAYDKYTRVANERGMTGVQAAQRLLSSQGLGYISIEGTPGDLTDHYDPRTKTLRLSSSVANTPSVAALGIVAHEVGHAIQDAQGFAPLKIRSAIVPAVQFGSMLGPLLFFVGLILHFTGLAWVGVAFFAMAMVFSVLTLPVELDASRRAMQLLNSSGLVSRFEADGVKSVLTAAALTYVAAVAQALSTLLYYVFLLTGMGGRRRSI
jgi:hypothetical protein